MTRPCGQSGREILDSLHPSARAHLATFGLECLFADRHNPHTLDSAIIEAIEGGAADIRTLLTDIGFRGDVGAVLTAIGEGKLLRTWLPPARQMEISNALAVDVPAAAKFHALPKNQAPPAEHTDDALRNPQWLTLATTPAVDGEEGHRISFSFFKKECQARALSDRVCRHCNLSAGMRGLEKVTTEQQLNALRVGLQQAHAFGGTFTVFEILPDGSFLNKEEVPHETQTGMMQILREEGSVKIVAVESRPEYCTAANVKRLLDNLRPEQHLKLYTGLESTDDGVAALSVNKGYGSDEFKNAIRRLKNGLAPEQMERLHLSAYNLMKPPYLTEREAIEDSVKTARDIKAFSDEIDVPIEVTCEPCVITKKTHQNYLYNQRDDNGERRYKPVSYFSAAEFIARLAEEGLEKTLKFGQRDDIDPYTIVAMVPRLDAEHLFSPFDFIVYNAVQRFNVHKNVPEFLLDMKLVVEHAPEFKAWEKEVYGTAGGSALSRLVKDMPEPSPEDLERVGFQKKVWKVRDRVENSTEFSAKLRAEDGRAEEEVKLGIRKFFEEAGMQVVKIGDLMLIDNSDPTEDALPTDGIADELRGASIKAIYQVEAIIFNEAGQPQSIWMQIPLVVPPAQPAPDFIYGDCV